MTRKKKFRLPKWLRFSRTKKEVIDEAVAEAKAKEVESYLSGHKKVSVGQMTLLLETMIDLMNNPWRMCWRNFWSGVFKGIGLTVGATIVIAFLVKILMAISSTEIPYVKDVSDELLEYIKPYHKNSAPSALENKPSRELMPDRQDEVSETEKQTKIDASVQP